MLHYRGLYVCCTTEDLCVLHYRGLYVFYITRSFACWHYVTQLWHWHAVSRTTLTVCNVLCSVLHTHRVSVDNFTLGFQRCMSLKLRNSRRRRHRRPLSVSSADFSDMSDSSEISGGRSIVSVVVSVVFSVKHVYVLVPILEPHADFYVHYVCLFFWCYCRVWV